MRFTIYMKHILTNTNISHIHTNWNRATHDINVKAAATQYFFGAGKMADRYEKTCSVSSFMFANDIVAYMC